MTRIKSKIPSKGRLVAEREEGASTDTLPPLFSLSHIEKGFCVKNCDKDEQAAVALALRDISALTWGGLKQAPRKGIGYENIYAIRKSIPAIAVSRQLIAFRVGELFRLVGFRERQTFFVLWIDPKGQVYKH